MNNHEVMHLIRRTRLCKITKQAAKTIVCLVLCVSLIWGYSYKEPAHAGAVATIAEFVLVSLCLSALGVTIGSAVGDKDSREYLNYVARSNEKLIKDGIDGCKYIGNGVVEVGSEVIEGIGNFVKSAWNNTAQDAEWIKYFGGLPTEYKNVTLDENFYRSIFGSDFDPAGLGYKVKMSKISILAAFNSGSVEAVRPGTEITLTSEYHMDGYYFNFTINGGEKLIAYGLKPLSDNDDQFPKLKFNKYVLIYFQPVDGKPGYSVICPNYNSERNWSKLETVGSGQVDAVPPTDRSDRNDLQREKFYCSGKSIALNPPKDVVDEMKKKCGVVDPTTGKTSIPLNNTGSNEQLDNNTLTQTQQQTLNQDIATEADKAAATEENAKNNSKERPKVPDLPDLSLPELITKKFPFSLPWDLYNAFANLAAPPKPPAYTFDFLKVPALKWDYKITLDLAPYDKLATLSRWGFSLLFVVGLILITRKIIGA